MTYPKPYLIFLSVMTLILISCEKETQSIELRTEVGTDNLPPQITSTILDKLIETKTELTFQIIDDSQITSLEIWVNGELVEHEIDNTIKLSINPYDFPIGELEIKIKAGDEHGNSQQVTEILELRRLLIKIPHSNILDPYYLDHYIFLNASDGTLLKVVKNKPYEDLSIYATEEFQDLTFTASLFSHTNDGNPNNYCRMYSFENIERGSILPTIQQIREQDIYEEYPEIDLLQDVSIITPNPENPAWLRGYGYWDNKLTDNTSRLNYSSSIEPNMLVRSFDLANGNSTGSFRYFWLTDLTRTSYGPNDFLTPNSFYEVKIPDSIKNMKAGQFFCEVNGFRSLQDYSDGKGHNVLSLGPGGNINVFSDGLTVPKISEFEIYDKTISASIGDNFTLETKQKGLEFKALPQMGIVHEGDSVVTSGDFDEILFEYNYYYVMDGFFDYFQWRYYTAVKDKVAIPFERFEIPFEIEAILSNRNLKPRSAGGGGTGSSVKLIKIENYTGYSNRLFEHNYYNRFPEWSTLKLDLKQ